MELSYVMTFRPALEDLKDFSKYIEYLESRNAHKAGICKIIPPHDWKPQKNGYNFDEINELLIKKPFQQIAMNTDGKYFQLHVKKEPMIVRKFYELNKLEEYKTPKHFDYDDLENKYWKNIFYIPPINGTCVNKSSLMDSNLKILNLNKLNTILDCIKYDYNIEIDGFNKPQLNFNMWKTTNVWYKENMDLYSINYLHFGASKTWYSISPKNCMQFEKILTELYKKNFENCETYLRHKTILINPKILNKNYQLPIYKIVQEPGEFIIKFPYSYTYDYNHGFNCTESINFATERWIEYGKRSIQCNCCEYNTKISMDTFIKRFQPENYENWLLGEDYGAHPEIPNKYYAAPLPMPHNFQGANIKRIKKPKLSNADEMEFIENNKKVSGNNEIENNNTLSKINFNEIEEINKVLDDSNLKSTKVKDLSNGKTIKNTNRMRFLTKIINLFELDEDNIED